MAQKSAREKMVAGELYRASAPELVRARARAKALCHAYNQHPVDLAAHILEELFGGATDAYIEPPFFCDYGFNIHLGQGVYANHNLVILDCARVDIGDGVLIAPNVVISTATHPLQAAERARGLELAKPIRIGQEAWLGASVNILPGVEIGARAVIGAGAVVTRSIPPDCVAAGVPCRVLRRL